MASRAHVVHDYSFGRPPERPRREVWYQNDDPVILPERGLLSASGGLILAALTSVALVAGSAYAVWYTPPPALEQTPTLPITRDYQLDPDIQRALVTSQLSGPSHAVPEQWRAGSDEGAPIDDAPLTSPDSSAASTGSSRSAQPHLDDSSSSAQPSFAEPRDNAPSAVTPPEIPAAPSTMPQAPYPTPTAPPEVVTPSDTAPSGSTPAPDAENPYQ